MKERASKIAFLVLLGVLMTAFVVVVRPFFFPALIALIVATICNPIYQWFLRIFRERRYLASLIATVIVIFCVIIPIGVAVAVIIIKVSEAVGYVQLQLEGGQAAAVLDGVSGWISTKASFVAGFLPAGFDLRTMLLGVLKSAGVIVYQYSPKVVVATANLIAVVFLIIIFVFVFFAEGGRLYKTVLGLLPLRDQHKEILAHEVRLVISATFLGMIATSVAQGLMIGIGFWIAGISNPLLWGLVAIGVTLVPVIGGPLMYVPAGVALLSSGHTGAGVFLLIYGVGIVSMIDNVVKPLVMRGKVNIHPLLLALSLIGGGLWLGPAGIITGPLVVVLMLACLRIYQREF